MFMPTLIACFTFVLVVMLFLPTKWLQVQKVKKGFVFMSSYVTSSTTRKIGLVHLITPFVMSMMAALRLRIRPKQRKDIQTKLIHAGLAENWTVENFVSVQAGSAVLVNVLSVSGLGKREFRLLPHRHRSRTDWILPAAAMDQAKDQKQAGIDTP